MSFEVDMTFTLNDIDLQMTITFEQALMEYKHVVTHGDGSKSNQIKMYFRKPQFAWML